MRRPNLTAQAIHIPLHPLLAKHPGGKVTEGTLRLAEWNGDIDTDSFRHFERRASLQLFHGDSFYRDVT
jgi:hypothetical protein